MIDKISEFTRENPNERAWQTAALSIQHVSHAEGGHIQEVQKQILNLFDEARANSNERG